MIVVRDESIFKFKLKSFQIEFEILMIYFLNLKWIGP